jgi:hypothetical protein
MFIFKKWKNPLAARKPIDPKATHGQDYLGSIDETWEGCQTGLAAQTSSEKNSRRPKAPARLDSPRSITRPKIL